MINLSKPKREEFIAKIEALKQNLERHKAI